MNHETPKSVISHPSTALRTSLQSPIRRFVRDQRGQGILFAAATLLLLVGFVALVYNVGRLTERRTKMQLAADAAAYSGAMLEANSLSAIAWINSAMAQIYYNTLKYAVDAHVAGVASEIEKRLGTPGPATQTYADAKSALALAKGWMVDLSRIENSIAILTPRFVQEETFAVSRQAGAERLSFYPSFRMFPRGSGSMSFRVEHFPNGWRVTNLTGGNGEMIYVFLQGNEWHLQYSQEGILIQEVVIEQESSDKWHIQYFQPPGNLVHEIYLVKTADLGWIVWGSTSDPGGGPPNPIPPLRFDPVDMDGDGIKEGIKVTQGDFSQVLMRGPDGDIYAWSAPLARYVKMTSSQTTIGGVTVQVNVTNEIHFPGATAHIGDPTTLDIGRSHIVLRDPPTISTGLGPVNISITGFDPNSFGISVGGFSLTAGDADGRWHKQYDVYNELWWRHRLTEQAPAAGALKQWQYDYQTIGALLREEPNLDRYVTRHAFGDRFGQDAALPEWTNWFDPVTGAPRQINAKPGAGSFDRVDRADGSYYYQIQQAAMDALKNDPTIYYQTSLNCSVCQGQGGTWQTDASDNRTWVLCPACEGKDYDRDGATDIRVFIYDLYAAQQADYKGGYLDARIHVVGEVPGYGRTRARLPLVLAEEFFQYGINIGTWMSPENPMFFPQNRQPAWGTAAISCARVGIPDPTATGNYRYNFDASECESGQRQQWCSDSSMNLYSADIRARLYPSKYQMNEYDLRNDILQGVSIRPSEESATSYLWDAVLGTGQTYETSNWLDAFHGRSDPRVGQSLRNMTNREGRAFQFWNEGIDEVVEH